MRRFSSALDSSLLLFASLLCVWPLWTRTGTDGIVFEGHYVVASGKHTGTTNAHEVRTGTDSCRRQLLFHEGRVWEYFGRATGSSCPIRPTAAHVSGIGHTRFGKPRSALLLRLELQSN
jgi:hypothetical protein